MKIPCTITVLTLNSGKTLRRCLESVKNCEEILILDGNSTDDTHAIAREYGARIEKQYDTVEQNVRAKDFSELRIKSFGLARYPWVFYVDSDEEVSQDLMSAVAKHVQENDSKKAGAFSRRAVVDGRLIEHAFFYPDWCVRLWHKESGVHFKENKVVHEQIAIPQGVEAVRLPGTLNALWPEYEAYKKKQEFYLSLVYKRMREKSPLVQSPVAWHLRGGFKNAIRSCGIAVKVFLYYVRYHGSFDLSLKYSLLFVLYHWRIAQMHFLALLKK